MYLLNKTMNGIRLYYLILLGILYLSFYQSSVYFLFFTNTILAYIPIELTFLAMYCKKKYIIVVVVCLWLVFLPNNFYLMTDLFHLSLLTPYDEVTLLISKDLMNWIKLFLILLAVMPSTILGCWSIDKIARILVEKLTIGVYPALLRVFYLWILLGFILGDLPVLIVQIFLCVTIKRFKKFSLILKILTIDRSYFYFCSIFFCAVS